MAACYPDLPTRFLVLFWFSLKYHVSHGFHCRLHLACLGKPSTLFSPLKMHSSPAVKSLKSEMGGKMKLMLHFSPRSCSVHFLRGLESEALRRIYIRYIVFTFYKALYSVTRQSSCLLSTLSGADGYRGLRH